MHRTTGGSEPSPARHRPPPSQAAAADDDVWFELEGSGWTLTGRGNGIVHQRIDDAGEAIVREWSYGDIRSFQVVDGGIGRSIVIEPVHGTLVAIPIDPDRTEEAYQAATVLGLLVARSQRSRAGPRPCR